MVLVVFAAISAFGFGLAGSNDLRAVWTAAQEVALGNPELVYPSSSPLFTMRPPDEWSAHLRAAGHQGDIYPYIYPPLWAWLLAPMTENISFDTIVLFMRFLNGAALVGGLFVARKLCLPSATDHQRLTFFSVGLAGLLLTHSGFVALYENQPQILVGFLTLLGIERNENGHPALGGAALALAAALKGYPALLAVFWIATGQRAALASFLIVGMALASLSVLLAGWPPHAAFLSVLHSISDTIILTPLSPTLDTSLGHMLWPFDFSFMPSLAITTDDKPMGWFILAKPALLATLDTIVLLSTLAAFGIAFRRLRHDSLGRRALWPAAMAGLTFVAPLAWSYHFIAPLCALGLLPVRLPQRGYLIAGFVIAGLSIPTLLLGSRATWPHIPGQLLGSLAIIGMIAAFIWVARNAQLVRSDPGTAPDLGKRTAPAN